MTVFAKVDQARRLGKVGVFFSWHVSAGRGAASMLMHSLIQKANRGPADIGSVPVVNGGAVHRTSLVATCAFATYYLPLLVLLSFLNRTYVQ